MAATNYSIAQIRNSNVLSSIYDLEVASVPPKSYYDEIQDFQQLVFYLENGTFSKGTSYLIDLNIPPDKNYNLNFGVRLMNLNVKRNQDLREKLDFQFIKYITIPKIDNQGTDVSNVWLYHIKEFNNQQQDINIGKFDGAENQKVVNAAVAVELDKQANEFNINWIYKNFAANQRANKFFYTTYTQPVSDLKKAIIAAKSRLNNYVNHDNYTEENWEQVYEIIAAAKVDLDNAVDIATINEIEANVIIQIDEIEQIEHEIEPEPTELDNYKTEQKAWINATIIVDEYSDSDIEAIQSIIDAAIIAIDAAENSETVDAAVNNATDATDAYQKNIDKVKTLAINYLQNYAIQSDYEDNIWENIQSIISTAIEDINAAENVSSIYSIRDNAKNSVDNQPKKVYSIQISNNIINGVIDEITLNPESTINSVKPGTMVSVNAISNQGYQLESITYIIEGSNEAIDITTEPTFIMPEANVIISATFMIADQETITDIWMCNSDGYLIDNNNTPITEISGDTPVYDAIPKNYFGFIEKNDVLLAHTFDTGGSSDVPPVSRQFIITPEQDGYNAIFLCLKLIPEDTDIQWTDINKHNMFGRHIDIYDTNTTIKGKCYPLKNILIDNNNRLTYTNVKNIAVWGRSEQLMAINGEEIKIGPSGYFELKLSDESFTIDSLCIANTQSTDKYIVDIQYIENN